MLLLAGRAYVARGTRSPATRACAAGTWNSGTPDEPSAPSPASEGLSYARQSPPPSQGSPFTRELEPSADAAAAGQQGSPKRREPSPYGSPLGRMPSEPGVLGARGAGTYKDAFASRDGGGRDYGDGYGGDARRRDAPYGAHGASAAGYHPSSAAESQVASQLLSSFARAALESGLEALTLTLTLALTLTLTLALTLTLTLALALTLTLTLTLTMRARRRAGRARGTRG